MSDSSGNRLSGPPPGGPERSPGELEELGRGLVDEVGDGTMTRRELVRRGGLLGLSAVAIGGLLAACGGDDDAAAPAPEPPAPAPEPAPAPAPEPPPEPPPEPAPEPPPEPEPEPPPAPELPDTLVVATSGPVLNIDPDGPDAINAITIGAHYSAYERLVATPFPVDPVQLAELQAAGFPVSPQFADSWEVSADQLTYRFNLRQGVTSHFGNILTADDVVWMVQKSLGSANIGSFLLAVVSGVAAESVKAIDENTVEFTLPQPNANFLPIMALPFFPIYDSAEVLTHATDDDPFGQEWLGDNAPGSGPYTIVSIADGGTRVTLEAFPEYSGPNPPQIQTVVLETVDDNASRLQLLLTDEAQFAYELTPLQLDEVEANENTVVSIYPSSRMAFLGMNNSQPPFDDLAIRQGMAYAVPYDDILQAVFRGRASRWRTPITAILQGATDEFWTYETDPEMARALLEPLADTTLDLSYPTASFAAQEVAILIQAALGDAGVDVVLEALPENIYNEKRLGRQLLFFIDELDAPIIPSALFNFQIFYASDGVANVHDYKNPELDAVVQELAIESDIERQNELIREGQRILVEDVVMVPIAQVNTPEGHSAALNAPVTHTFSTLFRWNDFNFTS